MEPDHIFLLPGQYCISKKPTSVTTILGSCVSVCIYTAIGKFGGINHYMLPHSSNGERSAKYGNFAIPLMLDFIQKETGSLSGVEAMIFGGANVVDSIHNENAIGRLNVSVAKNILRKMGIRVTKTITGGSSGMKLKYHTWSNEYRFRFIKNSNLS